MASATTTEPPVPTQDVLATGAGVPPTPGQYQVHLDVYEGPFDLLLQLIAKRRVDVTQVDLADITADFLASLQALDMVDLETATRFLVVAATLIEMKAARLLPTEQQEGLDDLLGDARDLLYARLLEYRAFRDVAHDLSRRFELHEAFVARDVPLDHRWRRLVPDTDLPISAEDLARIAAKATRPVPEPTVSIEHIRRSFISVRAAATQVLSTLASEEGVARFRTLVTGRTRGDAVVFFLALLELYKLGAVQIGQDEHHRGELTYEPGEHEVDVTVIADIEDEDVDESEDGAIEETAAEPVELIEGGAGP